MEKLRLVVDEKGKLELHMDGKKVFGFKSLEFYWEVGDVPTHKIEYFTHVAKTE